MEEDQEGARVLGLGVGLFLIILIWSLTLAAVLLLSRMAGGSSLSLVSLAILITALLLVIPREVLKQYIHENNDQILSPTIGKGYQGGGHRGAEAAN